MHTTITATAPPAALASPEALTMAAYLTHKFFLLQLFLLCGYGIMFALCVGLICYMRHHRTAAFTGDATAARKIILPAFEPLLWILGGATCTYTVYFTIALSLGLYTSEISKLSTEFFYSGRQFVFISVIVFLFQQSVSIPALRRTVFLSFLLSTYTIPVVWMLVHYGNIANYYPVMMVTRALLLVVYFVVLVRPPARASKRTLREYCAYTFVYYALLFTYMDMFRRKKADPGFTIMYANILWGALCPLVIWRVLQADTEHWRGLGQRAVALQGLFRQRRGRSPLDDERVSSQGLHLLIEMHRKYIIDFAYLEIKHQIGVGASATVFHGVLHNKTQVAVKVYTPSEFNEQTVAAFSHEAALCGALHHPNIVKFYGMCVCPPTIGLVSELCQASLDQIILLQQQQQPQDPYPLRHQNSGPQREQFLLDIAYMLDAARAVSYLHSFSPPFVHRDIKPSNFLVDMDGNVKLTDFGESRSLPRPHDATRGLHPYMVVASGAHVNSHGRYTRNTTHLQLSSSQTSLSASVSGSGTGTSGGAPLITMRGTVDYMAPEVINGRAGVASYGEAADVYSLAITMWDILHPGKEKFPTLRNNHLQIFESVIEGRRPLLEDHIHHSLREVIESAWHSDVRLRPSAHNVVHILEGIQEEVQAVFASQLLSELNTTSTITTTSSNTERPMGCTGKHTPQQRRLRTSSSLEACSFAGAEAIAHMVDSGYVATMSEGHRIGNALMDAGVMHHLHHSRGFEESSELYYFDENTISLCCPMVMESPLGRKRNEEEKLEHSGGRGSRVCTTTSSVDLEQTLPMTGRHNGDEPRRPLMEQHGLCACRKLGQRMKRNHPSRNSKRAKDAKKKQKKRNVKKTTTRKFGTIMEEMTTTRGLTRSLLLEEERGSENGAGIDMEMTENDHVAIDMSPPAGA